MGLRVYSQEVNMQHRVLRDAGSFSPSMGAQWTSHTKHAEELSKVTTGHAAGNYCSQEQTRALQFSAVLHLEVFYCPVTLALFTDLSHTGRGFRSGR